MRLDIGARLPAEYLQGSDWRTVDLADADYIAPMWELPFRDDSIDEIHTSHALEHIAKERVVPTLTEWHRVLKPGAPLTIRVPNLAYVCEQYLQALLVETIDMPVIGWNLDMLFGNQEHAGQFHQTGFSCRSLAWYATQARFRGATTAVIWSHNQQTIELHAFA